MIDEGPAGCTRAGFLSYRRSDTAAVGHALRYALLLAGHAVFLDIEQITTGATFRDVIRDWLATSNLVLFPHRTRVRPTGCTTPTASSGSNGARPASTAADSNSCSSTTPACPRPPPCPPSCAGSSSAASTVRTATLGHDIDTLVESVPHLAAQPRSCRVLWVDDHPASKHVQRAGQRPTHP